MTQFRLRRYFCCLCVATIAFLIPLRAETVGINTGFEETTSLGGVKAWSFESWLNTTDASAGETDDTVYHGGSRSLRITNRESDDSRFVQIIPVRAASWYRIGVWIKTDAVGESANGAGVSALNARQSSPDIRGTTDWTYVEVYGKTAKKQIELSLCLRLGFYGSINQGRAWFDDLTVEQVENKPDGAISISLSPETPDKPVTVSYSWWPILALLYAVFGLLYFGRRQQTLQRPGNVPAPGLRLLTISLLSTLVFIKLFLSSVTPGYPADTGTFTSWALEVFRLGPVRFYRPDYFADYPPGYIYLLYLVGATSQLFHIQPGTPAFRILLNLPAIAADVAGVIVLYRLGRKTQTGAETAYIAPLLWLISPLAIYASSVWGQVDSIFSLMLLIAFLKLEDGRRNRAAALFAVAVLLKPQALLVAPLAVLYLILAKPRGIKESLLPILSFAGTAIALALPFAIYQEPLWILKLYGSTLGSYDFASLNAANLWYLLGYNWQPTKTLLVGLPLYAWGWILSLSALAFVLYCLTKNRSREGWLIAAFSTFVIFFCLATRMHERYLYPAALLALGAFQRTRDRRLLWAAIASATVCFLDMYVTLSTVLTTGSTMVVSAEPLMFIASVTTLILTGWSLYLCHDILVRGRHRPLGEALPPKEEVPVSARPTDDEPPMPGPYGRRRALIALSVLTLAYALVSLYDLGGHRSPQRFWEPFNPGDSATFDLGTPIDLASISYHFGLGSGEYGLEYSADGQNWTAGNTIANDNAFAEIRWRRFPENRLTRYVRVTLVRGRLQLNELILENDKGKGFDAPILISQTETGGNTGPLSADRLFDEQTTGVAVSDYTNGMYFDEIFYARSAWEILQGRNASENTHPPLGKIIIASSIAAFGMNPFGWRLPGALAGIAMLPILYLLALALFRRRRWALLATALLAFDFMHFTQTRIATIDSFALLFVLCAYYWMIRWMQNTRADDGSDYSKRNPAWYLVASGFCIGLGIAVKWTALYAGAGLAVLFFWSFFSLGRAWLARQGLKTIAVCLLAFVALPLLIYTCAYIPLMSSTGTGISGMLDNQTSMWRYHSEMKETHPFSSPWYQWPLIRKPVWYYTGNASITGGLVSTIVALGNPVVWIGGSVAFVALLVWMLSRLIDRQPTFRLGIATIILISGLAQYLPWALIPRKLIFIYHFFLTVPFIILALVFMIRLISETKLGQKRLTHLWWMAAVAAGLFFLAYYPVLSGMPFPLVWAEVLKRLPVPVYF